MMLLTQLVALYNGARKPTLSLPATSSSARTAAPDAFPATMAVTSPATGCAASPRANGSAPLAGRPRWSRRPRRRQRRRPRSRPRRPRRPRKASECGECGECSERGACCEPGERLMRGIPVAREKFSESYAIGFYYLLLLFLIIFLSIEQSSSKTAHSSQRARAFSSIFLILR